MKKYVLFSIMLLLGALVFSTPVVAKFEKIPHEKSFAKKAVESVIVTSVDIVEVLRNSPPLINETSVTAINDVSILLSEKTNLSIEASKTVRINRQAVNNRYHKKRTNHYVFSYKRPDVPISNLCYHLKV